MKSVKTGEITIQETSPGTFVWHLTDPGQSIRQARGFGRHRSMQDAVHGSTEVAAVFGYQGAMISMLDADGNLSVPLQVSFVDELFTDEAANAVAVALLNTEPARQALCA